MTPPPLRLLKHKDQRVQVSQEVCEGLGFESVWARSGIDEEAAVLLRELQSERCGHSWRGVLGDVDPTDSKALVEAIGRISASKRPTSVYTYWGVGPHGEAPLAVAAISSHVSHEFPFDGFPVVARCMIRRCYRGRGLYPFLLAHRIRGCEALWGSRLRGIHIGASDPAVISSLAQREAGSLNFVCVGKEWLTVNEDSYWVPDFFAPTLAYRQAIQDELEESDPYVVGFAKKIDDFLQRGASAGSFGALCEAAASLRSRHGEAWWANRVETRAFFALMESIGVLHA